MAVFSKLFNYPKNRKTAVILALLGTVTPLAGLHKFALRLPLWGLIYFLLRFTPLSNIDLLLQSACAFEAVWYLVQDSQDFCNRFNLPILSQPSNLIYSQGIAAREIGEIAKALRELEKLREDGLLSEYEFEEKRRQLLELIS